MPLLGLIGYPLSHSFSPAYFREKFRSPGLGNWDYISFPIQSIEMLPGLIQANPGLIGLNVTIPYKEAVLSHCETFSREVAAIGAANCILVHRQDGEYSLEALNTDHIGFAASISGWYKPTRNKALVLGTGGASKAVQYALGNLGIPFDIAGRSQPLNYGTVRLARYDLVVNCTPVGMKGFETAILNLPYKEITEGTYYIDLVYNPAETLMMGEFSKRGAITMNGEKMLHIQADKAWDIFYKAHSGE